MNTRVDTTSNKTNSTTSDDESNRPNSNSTLSTVAVTGTHDSNNNGHDINNRCKISNNHND